MPYIPKRGLNVPIITVLDEQGRVREADQRHVIRHVLQDGCSADVIFANGTTGEWKRLSNAERQRLMVIAVDEVKQLRQQTGISAEIWLGVNGGTRAEVLANLKIAMEIGADAAVIAPLALEDLAEEGIVRFFQREVNDLVETAPTPLPVFLYDNADINAAHCHRTAAHIRTRAVRELSRLPWVCGLKVSATRRVLDNYTRAALHFKQPGEFGLYVGNANLIFEWFRPRQSWFGPRHLPIGVVAGPANVFPREWQKAWRVCWCGDEALMRDYEQLAVAFEQLTIFDDAAQPNQYNGKMIACLKMALRLEGVIDADAVAPGTPSLNEIERERFQRGYADLKQASRERLDARWRTVGVSRVAKGLAQSATSTLSLSM